VADSHSSDELFAIPIEDATAPPQSFEQEPLETTEKPRFRGF
jgi:hypothetical protein